MQQPVWIGGRWRPAERPAGFFQAVDPFTDEAFGDTYPISGWEDIRAALAAGRDAASASPDPDGIARFLEAYADQIDDRASELAETASRETALPVSPRLKDIEIPRTTDQLRQAAAAARDRSWRMAVIDGRLNIRSWHGPLHGPVVVLGPNNFPLAFNPVSGGDFAAALAAGNPVIAKAHPGHPNTTRLLVEAASEALERHPLPASMIQLVHHVQPDDGLALVSHPDVGAVAFTGSRASGLRLKRAADAAGGLIFLEMSGINPVVILPEALEERGDEIAAELAGSCTLGMGQFCTNPGLIILIEDEAGRRFLDKLAGCMGKTPAGTLLSRRVLDAWSASLEVLKGSGAEILAGGGIEPSGGMRARGTLLKVPVEAFLRQSRVLQTEAFGPSTLAVAAVDPGTMIAAVSALEGNLTGSVYSHSGGRDEALYARLEPLLRRKVGRLLNDKVPTGVAVTPAMHHGGPYPATGHPGFTSVGLPRALLRFTALQCYDNVRQNRLPPELQDRNPTGRMWRSIDGVLTRSDV